LRTAPEAAASDLYPVALARHVLRPGTAYADPYGHVLVLVGQRAGLLLAVEAQADGSIRGRRFTPGNFLHHPDPALGGSGFLRFRPTLERGGAVLQLDDDAITASLAHGDLWTGQAGLGLAEFQDRVDALLVTGARDPFLVQRDLVDDLTLAARERVAAVERGASPPPGRRGVVPMPTGFEIFAGTGPWQRLATPGRDLRLLAALRAVAGFVARVRSNPAAFGTPEGERGEPVLTQLIHERERLLADRTLRYRRSDGSEHTLSLADLVIRRPALERAYNPNDCPELRRGRPSATSSSAWRPTGPGSASPPRPRAATDPRTKTSGQAPSGARPRHDLA
ncbi:MAG: hypothetical protein JNK56_07800, partial [Myxococcales bacterium]|nr:hypothetical protein [Myxococcales bacterium]